LVQGLYLGLLVDSGNLQDA